MLFQPLEILKHRAVSVNFGFSVRAEVSTDPSLYSRDHLLSLLTFIAVDRLIRSSSVVYLCEAGVNP